MLPLLVLAGVVVTGGSVAIFKKKCELCDSYFTLNERCEFCGREVCGSCGEERGEELYKEWVIAAKGRYCKKHHDVLAKNIERTKAAIDCESGVELYSKNYKGEVPPLKLNKSIKSGFHLERDDAERELRILAAMKGCVCVTNVEFKRDVQASGNYQYSTWSCSGSV